MKALLDTNILIDYLNGVSAAKAELARYEYRAISTISWMEVLVGASREEDTLIRAWLGSFVIVPVDNAIASRAVDIRRASRIRLPDAIIWATAQIHSLLLVTRNTKDFPADEPGIRLPYTV